MDHKTLLKNLENPEHWERMIDEKGLEAVKKYATNLGRHRSAAVANQAVINHIKNSKDQKRAAIARQEEREEKTLELAREANQIASDSNTIAKGARLWAFGAFAVAALSAIVAVVSVIWPKFWTEIPALISAFIS